MSTIVDVDVNEDSSIYITNKQGVDNLNLYQSNQKISGKSVFNHHIFYIFKTISNTNYYLTVTYDDLDKLNLYNSNHECNDICIHHSEKILNLNCNQEYVSVLTRKYNDNGKLVLYLYKLHEIGQKYKLNLIHSIDLANGLLQSNLEYRYARDYNIFSLNKYIQDNIYQHVLVYLSNAIGEITIHVWNDDFNKNRKLTFQASSSPISFLKLSDNGEYLVTADQKGNKIKIWRVLDNDLKYHNIHLHNKVNWSNYRNVSLFKLHDLDQELNIQILISFKLSISTEFASYISNSNNIIKDIAFNNDYNYLSIVSNENIVYIFDIKQALVINSSSWISWGWTASYYNSFILPISKHHGFKLVHYDKNNNLHIITEHNNYLVYSSIKEINDITNHKMGLLFNCENLNIFIKS